MAKGKDTTITTRFTADVSQFQKGIKDANNSIKQANAEFKNATATMDKTTDSTNIYGATVKKLTTVLAAEEKKLNELKKQQKAINDQYGKNEKTLTQLKNKYDQVVQSLGKNSDEAKKLKSEIDRITEAQLKNKDASEKLTLKILNQDTAYKKVQKQLNDTEKDLKDFGDESKSTGKSIEQLKAEALKSQQSIKGVGESAKDASDGFTVMKGAIANVIAQGFTKLTDAAIQGAKDIYNFGVEYSKTVKKLQSQTGSTNKEMKEFEKVLKNLYKNNYGESMDDLAEALAIVKQNTNEIDPTKLGKMTKNAIALRDVFGMDLQETIRGVNGLMQNMGVDADTAFDLITKGAQNGLDKSNELGDNLAEYTQLWGQAGFSAEEMFSILDNGLKSGAYNLDKVNDFVKEFTISLADGRIEDNLSSFSKETQTLFKAWKNGKATASDVFKSVVKDLGSAKNEQDSLTLASNVWSALGEDNAMKVITSLYNVNDTFKDVKGTMDDVNKTNYQQSQDEIKKLGRTLQTDLLVPLANKLLPEINKYVKQYSPQIKSSLTWVVKNLPQIAKTIGTIAVAYGTYKTSVKGANAVLTVQSTIQALLTKKTVAQTTATVAATTAQKALNTAQKANAFGLALTGVTLLVGGLIKLMKASNDASKETDKETIATEKLMKKQKELTKELKESAKARKENISDAEKQTSTADVLFRKLQELEGVENKSNSQKETMVRLVSELNTIMPDLNLQYDKEKDKLNLSTEAIRENIDAQKELILAKAQQENLIKIAKKISDIEIQQKDLLEQKVKNEKEYNKAKKELDEFILKNGTDVIKMTQSQREEYAKLQGEESKRKHNLEDTNTSIEKNKTSLENLNSEYQKTGEYIEENYSKAEINQALSKLVEEAKTKGIEIPKAVKTGIEEGRYAIPQGMEQLQTLINFDKALQQAGLEGKKIPQYISDGLMNGKYTIEEAIATTKNVIDMSDKVKQMNIDGKTMSKNVSDGILSGKYTVEQASAMIERSVKFDKMLSTASETGKAVGEKLSEKVREGKISLTSAINELNSVTKFEDIVKKADESGKKVGESLATKIRDGKLKPQEAINEMNALTNFNDLKKKADEVGIIVPDSITQGIEKGKIKPSQAVSRMNSLISYREALDKAGLEGAKIPELFSTSILSGEIKVKDANKYVNNLISFKEANQKSIDSGYAIPETLSNGILSGEVSVKKANTQMNRWIEFQKAHDKSKFSGEKIPKNIEEGVLNGKYSVKQAMAILNGEMDAEMDKQPPKAKEKATKTGEEYSSGIISTKPLVYKSANVISTTAVSELDKSGEASTKGSNTGSGYVGGMESQKENIKTKASEIGNEAVSKLDKKESAKTAGSNLIDGAKEGADSSSKKKGGFLETVGSIASKAVKLLKSVWNEHSPSKVTYSLADYFVQGLTNGVNDNAKYFDKSVQNMALSAVKTLNNSSSTFRDIGKTTASSYALGLGSLKSGLTVNGLDNGTFSQVKQSLSSSGGIVSNSTSSINNNASNSQKPSVVNNFYQTNNSPKSLSQLEIYRQTHNLLNMQKGGI